MNARAPMQPVDTSEVPQLTEARPADLAAALNRCAIRLDAAALLLSAPRRFLHRTLARSEHGAALIEKLWRSRAAQLLERTRTSPEAYGTNRIRLEDHGPVQGRLLAIGLRDAVQADIGLLLVVRTAGQDAFRTSDSRVLQELAAAIAELIVTDHDAVTGLLTRVAFERRARLAIAECTGTAGCVLYGDIDELHALNKLHGFAAGDRAIAAVGAALREATLPDGALACHLSGDRFTLWLPHSTLAQGRNLAAELRRAVAARATSGATGLPPLSLSFGVATLEPGSTGLGHALAAAESACKAAKDRGRGRVEIYQDADASIVRRHDDVMLAARLREALDAGRIELLAQPITRLPGDGTPTHYELLVRILSESGARMSPEAFLSAALRYQLLPLLDRAVLSLAFTMLKEARAALEGRGLRFSLNLSGPTIGDPEFLEWISSSIGAQEIPGEWLQLELTETAAVADIGRTQAMIRRLGARGVHFALDDFGTGVSSLAYLQAFDVRMLKLHGSFVSGLTASPRAESLVMGIAWLARTMGMETVAECVETEAVRDRLVQLGVDCGQGYLFGRPAPLADLLASLRGTAHG